MNGNDHADGAIYASCPLCTWREAADDSEQAERQSRDHFDDAHWQG